MGRKDCKYWVVPVVPRKPGTQTIYLQVRQSALLRRLGDLEVRRSRPGIVQNKVINVSARILTTEYGQLQKIAALEDRSMANVVRRLVQGKIKQYKEKGLVD